ncbi:energy transducer TonB [Hymenobacter lutimineralis]|uniref:Energy transducer TonB n=1 Tax=Hymenobacter lutimineralis TaxID=2606448 RepID=A0A5D6VE16_9BACT|nr:energy transducer TonB [Hymenobacter lutimineralis]TYZ13537.1 energy transducer TonB [Hymenobacter lutimineralis]
MKQTLLCTFLLLLLSASAATAQRTRKTEYESGTLEKGNKVGVWEYYAYTRDGTQVLAQKYDHSKNQLLFYRPIEDRIYRIKEGENWTSGRVDQPPLFLGGDAMLGSFVNKLNYPAEAQSKKIQGKVIITFVIDTLGRTSDHQVLLGIGGGCNEEALRVAKNIPQQWIPARRGSKAVPVVYEMPFTFRLQTQ